MFGSYGLELVRPGWLATLLATGVLAFFFTRTLVDFDSWQRKTSLGVRALLLVLLTLSLSGLTLLEPTRQQFVVFAMDRSLSVGDESVDASAEFVRKALEGRGEEEVAFLEFATEPGVLQEQFVTPEPDEPEPVSTEPGAAPPMSA